MNKQIFHLLLATVITVIYTACGFLKESESEEEQAAGCTNTLNENLGGAQGSISEYFYNFENDVNATFFRYNPNLMANYDTYMD